MEKRYVAGQAIDKEALLKALQEREVDEAWVNFENPFNYVRSEHVLDFIYLVWHDDSKSKRYWSHSSSVIIGIFDPDNDSDEDDIVAQVNMLAFYGVSSEKVFDLTKEDGSTPLKIYDKEVGLIG